MYPTCHSSSTQSPSTVRMKPEGWVRPFQDSRPRWEAQQLHRNKIISHRSGNLRPNLEHTHDREIHPPLHARIVSLASFVGSNILPRASVLPSPEARWLSNSWSSPRTFWRYFYRYLCPSRFHAGIAFHWVRQSPNLHNGRVDTECLGSPTALRPSVRLGSFSAVKAQEEIGSGHLVVIYDRYYVCMTHFRSCPSGFTISRFNSVIRHRKRLRSKPSSLKRIDRNSLLNW